MTCRQITNWSLTGQPRKFQLVNYCKNDWLQRYHAQACMWQQLRHINASVNLAASHFAEEEGMEEKQEEED